MSTLFVKPDGSPLHVHIQPDEEDGIPLAQVKVVMKHVRQRGGRYCSAADAEIIFVAKYTDTAEEQVRQWGGDKGKVVLEYGWVEKCISEGRMLREEDDWGGCREDKIPPLSLSVPSHPDPPQSAAHDSVVGFGPARILPGRSTEVPNQYCPSVADPRSEASSSSIPPVSDIHSLRPEAQDTRLNLPIPNQTAPALTAVDGVVVPTYPRTEGQPSQSHSVEPVAFVAFSTAVQNHASSSQFPPASLPQQMLSTPSPSHSVELPTPPRTGDRLPSQRPQPAGDSIVGRSVPNANAVYSDELRIPSEAPPSRADLTSLRDRRQSSQTSDRPVLSKIFTDTETAVPLKFFVPPGVPGRTALRNLIIDNGGKMCPKREDSDYGYVGDSKEPRSQPSVMDERKPVFNSAWLQACIDKGKLLSDGEYSSTPPSREQDSQRITPPMQSSDVEAAPTTPAAQGTELGEPDAADADPPGILVDESDQQEGSSSLRSRPTRRSMSSKTPAGTSQLSTLNAAAANEASDSADEEKDELDDEDEPIRSVPTKPTARKHVRRVSFSREDEETFLQLVKRMRACPKPRSSWNQVYDAAAERMPKYEPHDWRNWRSRTRNLARVDAVLGESTSEPPKVRGIPPPPKPPSGPFTFHSKADGRKTLKYDKADEEYLIQYAQWKLKYFPGTVIQTILSEITALHPTDRTELHWTAWFLRWEEFFTERIFGRKSQELKLCRNKLKAKQLQAQREEEELRVGKDTWEKQKGTAYAPDDESKRRPKKREAPDASEESPRRKKSRIE